MNILGLETSCDETAAAIVTTRENTLTILSNVLASSLSLHAKTGGIIPEVAAREQIRYILPVVQKALADANLKPSDIDRVAVTCGPGLIGSLLVGVETAKTLSLVWNKPLIPVNHLYGHIYANFIEEKSKIEFPAVALIVSGGHTDLVYMQTNQDLQWIGGTRDDAAGEAFDKIGRLLGLSYPAGPQIENLAKKGDTKAYSFPRPLIYSDDFDFSFSGLKTAVLRQTQTMKQLNRVKRGLSNETISNFCASTQQAIIDVLIAKTLKAAKKYAVKSILLGGGVAANETLTEQLKLNVKRSPLDASIYVPPKSLCTDNAAMIASAAFFHSRPQHYTQVSANPQLYFD